VALATYSDLTAAIASWLHRDDLAAQIPDFVTLAESRLNRVLRTRQQMTADTLSATAGVATVPLPADWLEFNRLRLTAPNRPLEMMGAHEFDSAYPEGANGSPRHYRIEGGNLLLGPTPDANYSLPAIYYAAIPALSNSTPTNWLLTAWPSLYLFGALAESAPFVGDDQRAVVWEGKFAAELAAAQKADAQATAAGSALRIKAR
jgi:hypothetical protein